MTDDEWDGFIGTLVDCFQGDLTDQEQNSYRVFLGRHDPVELLAAAATLVEQGKVYMPKPGEIVAALRASQDEKVPGWGEAWSLIQRAMNRSARKGGPGAVKTAAGVALLEEQGQPIVARFYELKTYPVLGFIEFWDPEYGALRIRDLKAEWEEFVDVAKQRLLQGRALEAIGARREVGPARLDEVALLDSLRPAVAGELEAGASGDAGTMPS